ncbi:nucleolar pre-ribosomal-associated protein 1 [Anoplophora glabripennis]|nr:nucleolar pre-ribosomal-associated protein 1 [Anoplophora glabripennis]
MEVDEEIPHAKSVLKKHFNKPNENVQSTENIKKIKLFSAKEFRKNLRQDDRVTALKQFLNIISESNGHDYVFEYLESGGNCLELLQTLELDSTLSPVLVFELVTHVLLKITVSGPKYQSAAFESCRYMLNNYITVINKMLNLSSKSQERKVCLKLLTAMITFSSTLSKDVLLHVNFHSSNVELLTKNTGEENSVRDHFIRFLTAFLIDGHYQSLSMLLEKKGFITSIIKGLQFDAADTVCIVISAMKNHILENPSVSKTAKMKIFNTLVVRDIVNLYNWKGPAALKMQEKNKTISHTVDEYSKSKVNECVHDFLLVLCTSHKYGVIFKDHSLGLGKKHQNALMYTVLESLERPWEHSYACELVTNICVACPDLTKTMWTNLKSSLEPRLTEKWLNAMKFAKNLLRELQPSCIEFCANELNINQLAQVIQILVAPLPILKVVLPINGTFASHAVKKHVMSFLVEMLHSLNSYLDTSKDWLNAESHRKLKTFVSSYVSKNFPNANAILSDWEAENINDTEQSAIITDENFLEIVFDIFDLYSKIAPQLLDSLNSTSLQLTDFLKKLSSSCADEKISARLQVKMINIFIELEPTNFSPNTELFSFVLPLLLKFYYETVDSTALTVLNKLLKYTGIFEGCLEEVNVWINAILNLRHFDDAVVQSLTQILRISAENIMEFSEELSLLETTNDTDGNIAKIIEKLKNTNITFEEESVIVKHKYLSPMVLGLVSYLKETALTKNLKCYVNFVMLNLFHCQTQMKMVAAFVRKYEIIPKAIKEYVLCWTEKGEVAYFKLKGRLHAFESFNEEFISGNIGNALNSIDFNIYPDFPLNLLQAGVFYITNIVNNSVFVENIFENCLKFLRQLIGRKSFHESYTETVLAHPVLLDHFSVLHIETNACTKFLLDVIKLLLDSGFDIARYLKIYKEKLLKVVLKILRKPKKYNFANFKDILELFGLSYDQCHKVLTVFAQSTENDKHFVLVLDILSYTLKRFASLYEIEDNMEPLEGIVAENLTSYFVTLTKIQDFNVVSLSDAFHTYFEVFPHHIKHVDANLLSSLVNLEYNKENISLVTFLLERCIEFLESIKNNWDDICNRKSVLLPILEVLVRKNVDAVVLKQIYHIIEPSLAKALLKPQKVGQHFHVSYRGLIVLIEKFMPLEKCGNFTEKVQKFEVTEVFHVKLLEIVFNKIIDDSITAKQVNNMILTFVHLQMQVFKRNVKDSSVDSKISEVAESFNNILTKIRSKTSTMDLKNTCQNETLKSYIMYCLKFGISGQTILLRSLNNMVKVLSNSMEKKDGKLIMDMLLSHSKFLDIVLDEHTPVKLEILSLFLTLCRIWNEFMERYHIPVLLAAYRVMINPCDRIIWTLLKMYAANSGQTNFYDFKPFLWGRAAANHYSVRENPEKSLWRQPKMRDVLDILQEEYVVSSIYNYPLKENLLLTDDETLEIKKVKSYDVKFLLPLFSHLLAPEQQVQTYTFTRSGALSLTVMTLSSGDEKIRREAFHVLSRFYYHVDASQHGKDNPLWLRYVEAVCKGVAVSQDRKLNNFSAVYLARMALILTQPNHVMYLPLSNHLTAKLSLDFSTVPELYTFLHGSDINYKDRRHFILELLRDGLRSEKDFTDFLRSMAFKLFSELYNSSLADLDTRLLILDVIRAACKIPLGAKMICENHSLLTQLFHDVNSVLVLPSKEKQEARLCVTKIVFILLEIVRTLQDVHPRFMTFNTVLKVVKDDIFGILTDGDKRVIFEVLYLVSGQFMELFTDDVVNVLLEKSGDKFCKYVVKYGCEFVDVNCLNSDDVCYYLRLLIFNQIKT